MKKVLRLAGQHGAAIVIAGVVIGLAIPWVSEIARPYLAIAIFIFTFGSFLKFDSKTFQNEFASFQRNLLIVLWATFGIPIVVIGIIGFFDPAPNLPKGCCSGRWCRHHLPASLSPPSCG